MAIFCSVLPAFCQEASVDFEPAPDRPFFISGKMMLDAEEYSTLSIRIQSSQSGTARLFWSISYNPEFNAAKSSWFFLKKGERTYYFNLPSQNPHWMGWINGFLLLPEIDRDLVNIREAKINGGGIFSFLASGWQEFWGPSGRVIEGSTVNNFKPILLFGKPVNLYIYTIVIIIGIISFFYLLLISKNASFAWMNCGKIMIISALFVWAFLIMSYLSTQLKWAGQDLSTFGFKSLEEKRGLATRDMGADFYSFIEFCRSHLPERAKAKFITSGPNADYPRGRAAYFLYPIDLFSKQPEYIIIYRYDKEPKAVYTEFPGFYLYKKFSERNYILCKKTT